MDDWNTQHYQVCILYIVSLFLWYPIFDPCYLFFFPVSIFRGQTQRLQRIFPVTVGRFDVERTSSQYRFGASLCISPARGRKRARKRRRTTKRFSDEKWSEVGCRDSGHENQSPLQRLNIKVSPFFCAMKKGLYVFGF